LGKHLPELRDHQREHRWVADEPEDLTGRTVMILGHGSIGEAVADRLAPLEVDLIRVARRRRAGVHGVVELPDLLPSAQVLIVLHLAGDSRAASRSAFALVGEQVRRWVSGERLINVVEHGY